MNQSEVEQAVARATGESRRFIKRYGFSIVAEEPEGSTDAGLAIDCPGCGTVFNLDGIENSLSELECPRCDAVYPVGTHELYVVDRPLAATAAYV
jgi:uncharacterized paraquat-inducible protein A